MIFQGSKRYPVTEVILHTAATPGDWHVGKSANEMRDEIRRWHMHPRPPKKPWIDIGYHRLFAPNGDMAMGRSIYTIGAHVKGRNRGTVGLCLIPVRTHRGVKRFEDYFTEEQRISVRQYIADLAAQTPVERVTGHNIYAAKECPGFHVQTEDWL